VSQSLKVAKEAADTLTQNKADDVLILDVGDSFQLAQFFVIGSGQSNPHLDFLVKELRNTLREDLEREPRGPEGTAEQGWLLADYGDVIIHLFTEDEREFYDLESLWGDAEVISA
jgi:ribosome-associated protein